MIISLAVGAQLWLTTKSSSLVANFSEVKIGKGNCSINKMKQKKSISNVKMQKD
jgi:hypothetical protein